MSQFLTVVYAIAAPGQVRALLEGEHEWAASSHSHALQERDVARAEVKRLRATLEQIARHPTTRKEELSAAGLRRLARAAIGWPETHHDAAL